MEMGANVNNIVAILLKCMVKYWGVFNEVFGSRWVWLGCDGDFMFQGHHTFVISQLKFKFVPFLINENMTHWTKMAIVVLSK